MRKPQLFIVFVATILIVLDVSLVFVAMIHDKETRVMTMQETLQRSVQDLSDQLDSEFDIFSRTLTGISEVVSIKGGLDNVDERTLHRLLVRRNAITPSLRSILVLRPDGSLAGSSTSYPVSHINFSDREYFKTQADTFDQGFFIGEPIKSRFDNIPVIPVSVRIVSDGGLFLGVAAAGMVQDRIAQLLAKQTLPAKFSLKILSSHAKPLACLPKDVICDHADLSQSELFVRHLKEQRAGQSWNFSLFGESAGLAAYQASERFPFIVVGQVDAEHDLEGWLESVIEYIVIGLSTNLALILFGIYGVRLFQARENALNQLQMLNLSLESRIEERTIDLLQSKKQIQQIFSGSPVAMLNVGKEGKISHCNDEAMRLFDGNETDLVGRIVEDFIPHDVRHKHCADREHYWLNPYSGRMGKQREFTMLTCKGHLLPVEIGIAPVEMEEDRSVVLAITDISARKKAEIELAQYRDHLEEMVHERTLQLAQARDDAESASRAKSAILDNMSHELRTPLHQIIGLAQIIQNKSTDERQSRQIGQLLEAGKRLTQLIEDVLDLAKVESGRMSIKAEAFNLHTLLENSLECFRGLAEKKSLNLQIDHGAGLPERLYGDAQRITEVLNCLLDNAIKFTPSGTITLHSQLIGQTNSLTKVRLIVSDTGIGISPENQSELFKSFTQLDGSHTRNFGGAGVGLSLSKRLVELMGGEIGFESTKDEGSRFWISLSLPNSVNQLPLDK